jgi:hypothetical protein
MTDERPTEQENTPDETEPALDSAPEPADDAEPAEATLPSEGAAAAGETSPAPPVAPTEEAPPDPSVEAGASQAGPATHELEAQSKFGAPASSLGIRPSPDQSKAGLAPATGLVARPPVQPRSPVNGTGSGARDVPPSPTFVPPAALPAPPSAAAPAAAPPAVGPAPAPYRPAPAPAPGPAPRSAPAPAEDDGEEEEALTWADRFRRLSPALVTLGIGSIGALGFLIYAMTSHTTPVAVLLSAGVVVTLAFAADATIASIATWRAAVQDEDPGRALVLAIVAGGSAVICAGALGATTVLLLLLNNM